MTGQGRKHPNAARVCFLPTSRESRQEAARGRGGEEEEATLKRGTSTATSRLSWCLGPVVVTGTASSTAPLRDPNQHLLKSGLCHRSELWVRPKGRCSPAAQGMASGKRALGGPHGSQGTQNPKSYRGIHSALLILIPPGVGL